MFISEMPKRWREVFAPVKQVGQAEYAAMYNCIASGLEDIPEDEQLGLIQGMLQEFLGWATALLKDLPNGDTEPWGAVVRFPVEKVLSWELYKEALRWALVDAAGDTVDIPEKYWDTWMGSVKLDGDYFIVTLEGGE